MKWCKNQMGYVLIPDSTEEAAQIFNLIDKDLKPDTLTRKLTFEEIRAINGYCKNIHSEGDALA